MIALLEFHLATGVRIALRAAIPLAGAAVAVVGLQENPGAVIERVAQAIAGSPPSETALVVFSLFSFGLASWATPRVVLGSNGWIRHLPASAMQQRLALVLAVACTGAPVVVAAIGCAVLVSIRSGAVAWQGFLLPPIITTATAALAFGLRRRRLRIRLFALPRAVPFEGKIAIRALGFRVWSGWLAGAIPLVATFLFLRNNVLPPHHVGLAARFGGTLAVAFTVAQVADFLAIRRPPWPWARTLPVSAATRVAADMTFLSAMCVPTVAVVAGLDPLAALAVAAAIPLIVARAVTAMRRGGLSQTAIAGPVLIEGSFAAALLAQVPWMALASLAVLPLAFHDAVRRERAIKVTRWSALHHVAAGDTLSWTA